MIEDLKRLHLLARICGERVALPATDIESVIELETLMPIPRVGAHVAGLAPLRSRVLTIIDAAASIGLPASRVSAQPAVVVAVEGHSYGILVDEIEDVVPCQASPRAIGRGYATGWSRVVTGTIEQDGEAVLLIDVAAVIAGPPALAA